MNIKIEREKRKTISLKIIDCENAVIKAPKSLALSRIEQFINSKKGWIKKTISKLDQKQKFAENYDLKNELFLFGEKVGKVCELANLNKNGIQKFYKTKFNEIVEMAELISKKTSLGFSEIKMHNSVRVWGSYSLSGVMKLNWKLVLLPKPLIEYVVLHELCHSKEMNHSKNFWNLVRSYCPNYKHLKQSLSNFSFVLKYSF